MELKVVLNDSKTGKSYQKALDDNTSKSLLNKKIGDTIKGELIDLTGYEFEITGGSDSSGFPMRKDVKGSARKRLLLTAGTIGFKKGKRKGLRRRRTIAGNTIHEKIAQVNLKILKHGKTPLDVPTEAQAPAQTEAPTEKPAEAPKVEEKKEAVKEEPKEEKSEPKTEEKTAKEKESKAEEKAEEKKE
ncbi:30S ribosomal protein S6e [Candidatus Woesearchaeota archaeon]|nr:30S ribosomal protein S6e [Candidatus Woesearchaeota archaeon]